MSQCVLRVARIQSRLVVCVVREGLLGRHFSVGDGFKQRFLHFLAHAVDLAGCVVGVLLQSSELVCAESLLYFELDLK